MYFEASRIDKRLLETPPFVDALRRIELTIVNPNLSIKFAQTCVPVLRNENVYDSARSQQHILDIFRHQVTVLQNINLKIANFTDSWSTFTLANKTCSSFDKITVDKAVIFGAANVGPDDNEAYSRLTFFFYARMIHEIAHACLAEMGRQLPSGDDEERFSSPVTHGLTGEAGEALERHFLAQW